MRAARRWLLPAFALFLLSLNRPTLADDSLWQKLIGEARQFKYEGRYAEAEKAYSLALAEAEKFGPEDRRLPLSLNELAILHHSRGQLNEAELLYRRALAIKEKVSESFEVATLLNNLA